MTYFSIALWLCTAILYIFLPTTQCLNKCCVESVLCFVIKEVQKLLLQYANGCEERGNILGLKSPRKRGMVRGGYDIQQDWHAM